LLPGLEVRQKHPLQAIAKRPTDAQHCLKVLAPGAGYKLALVGGMGDLVQIAADAPELADGAHESQYSALRASPLSGAALTGVIPPPLLPPSTDSG